MQDISNLNGIFGDMQALQGKLKSRLADVEQNAEKFKTALQAAIKPETKAELVSSLKEKSSTLLNGNGYATDLVSQIQASWAALGEQLQAPQSAPAPVIAPVVSANTTSTAATASSIATTSAAASVNTVASASTTAPVVASTAKTPAATPPVAAPATSIAPVNTTHPPYRVYDPANPSAFAEPTNPGAGPNLLAADLVFNPDPRPDSVHSLKYPVATGTADRGEQLKNYEIAYEKLSSENNAWNQKNIAIRSQTLLNSPYAAFANVKGVNLAAQSDPYTQAYIADPNKAPG